MRVRIEANKVAEQLFKTEDAIDVAINEMAMMAAVLPSARSEANISAVVGQGAFDRCSGALAALVLARKEMAVHGELSEVKDQVGLRHVAIGGQDKPPPNSVSPEGRAFTVVEASRSA